MVRNWVAAAVAAVLLLIPVAMYLTGHESQEDSCRHQLSREYALHWRFDDTHDGKCDGLTPARVETIKAAVAAEYRRDHQ